MENKYQSLRARIAQLSKRPVVHNMLNLFEKKNTFESLADFEADSEQSIWHYFKKAIHLSRRSYEATPECILGLFQDVREIALMIRNDRWSASQEHLVVIKAGRYDYNSASEYVGGFPEREQFVWHMLLWFLPEKSDWAEIAEHRIDVVSDRMKARLRFDEKMEEKLEEEILKKAEQEDEKLAELPKEVPDIFVPKVGGKRVDFDKLHEAIVEMCSQVPQKNQLPMKAHFFLIEVGLYLNNYIRSFDSHTEFIEVLEKWGIVEKGYLKPGDLAQKKNQLGLGDYNYLTWKNKLDNHPLYVKLQQTLLEKMRGN